MAITYGSVCSGIESASVAWEPLGMTPAWFAEIEPFPCKVLAHHWPRVTNLGDMTHLPDLIRMGLVNAPDILVGGTPCQAFSVAGKQMSMDDARGQLTLVYGDILNAIDERRADDVHGAAVAVWENVPGVLSTKDNAFGWFLGLLAGEFTLADCLGGTAQPLEAQPGEDRQKWPKSGCVIGPRRTVAWRVLDAQYFGLAQRRRRVFVVASARKGFDPAEVLFERKSVRRDIAPSREAWSIASALTANGVGTCGADDNQAQAGHLVVHGTQDPCVNANLAHTLGRNNGGENAITQYGDVAGTLTARHDSSPCHDRGMNIVVTHPLTLRGRGAEIGEPELANTLKASQGGGDKPYVVTQTPIVRRLTPNECERLQGFPDGHTAIPGAADGNRYKALGNSKAVPVVRWIGHRVMEALNG